MHSRTQPMNLIEIPCWHGFTGRVVYYDWIGQKGNTIGTGVPVSCNTLKMFTGKVGVLGLAGERAASAEAAF